jgi:hypothetical protein
MKLRVGTLILAPPPQPRVSHRAGKLCSMHSDPLHPYTQSHVFVWEELTL